MKINKDHTVLNGLEVFVLCTLFSWLILFSCRCFNPKKAQKQFGRVAATYPEIPADYCARIYPPKDSLIHGKDSIQVDTFWSSETIIRDSIIHDKDTVRIFYTKQLPGTVITRTISRTDTVYQENIALVDKQNTTIDKLTTITNSAIKEKDKQLEDKKLWRKLALGTWLLFILGFLLRSALKKYKIV